MVEPVSVLKRSKMSSRFTNANKVAKLLLERSVGCTDESPATRNAERVHGEERGELIGRSIKTCVLLPICPSQSAYLGYF